MNRYYAIALSLFFLMTASPLSYAQSVDESITLLGEEIYNFGDKKDALTLFLQALESNPDNVKANYMAGKCYLETINKYKSVPYFLKAYEKNHDVSFDILFKIASGYHYGARFDDAIKYYIMYRSSLTKEKVEKMKISASEEKILIERKIFECDNGKGYYSAPKDVVIKNINDTVNSEYPDYAPAISANQSMMIFTSRRSGGVGKNKDVDNEYFEDIWMTKKVNGRWTYPRNLGRPVNSETHDASIGFSPDGKTLFIYKPENGGDIYFSQKFNDTSWSTPLNMGSVINSKYAEPSVSISNNGNTIYFASDKPGGTGKLDIYKSEKKPDGKWGKPVNLGLQVNTPYDEDSPYIDIDGKTLFFSSKGHKGMGGFDIYKTEYDPLSQKWTVPENMGYPVNSPDDDIYFAISGDGNTGYYASAKEGGYGENDIYVIDMKKVPFTKNQPLPDIKEIKTERKDKPVNPTVPAIPLGIIFKGSVFDAKTKNPLEARIMLKMIGKEDLPTTFKTNEAGKFEIELPTLNVAYSIEVIKNGYLFYSDIIPASKSTDVITKDIFLKKIEIGSKIVLKNVFFDVNKTSLRDESYNELDLFFELLIKNPNLKIEISGHSDNKGSLDINKKLSSARAKAVTDYLIKKGIKPERLKSVGYGSERPIALNDSDDNRQLNRRTEFEIIGN